MSRRSVVTVAGAGAMGLTAALRLALAGFEVVLCDPAPLGDSASGVAAGMLAPAFEALLDAEAAGHFPTLLAARDRWPDLLAEIDAPQGLIDRSGAVLAAFEEEGAALEAHAAGLAALGIVPQELDGRDLRALQSGLSPAAVRGLYTPQDWRLGPQEALRTLQAAFARAGGRIVPERLQFIHGRFHLAGELVLGPVVLASGADGGDLAAAAPELACLHPIKGQILHFAVPPLDGPTVRGMAGYVAPQGSGAVAGATMEAGRRDRALDPAALAGLRAMASRLFPALAEAPATGLAGVRATTPDGLPLVGRSAGGTAGEVILCVGARRNGWLLAPLAAELVVRVLKGGAVGGDLAPDRFGRSRPT